MTFFTAQNNFSGNNSWGADPRTGLGLLLWQRVSEFLIEWVETSISVELNVLSLWMVAALQVIAVAIVTVIVALPMAKRANLMKRK